MRLSLRMRRLSRLVTDGYRLADVGTDHGYIPIALVREGRIPSAIAMDVNEGPLARAEEHIRRSGLSTYIETRLSDGLARLSSGEADTVLIAGMGGMLTVRILSEGAHCLDTVKELILQPQSDIHMVRKWLREHGFCILVEDILTEEGKYYPMLKAAHGQEREWSEAELYYGKTDVQKSPELLRLYLETKLARNRKIAKSLRQSGREGLERMREVMEDTERINRRLLET